MAFWKAGAPLGTRSGRCVPYGSEGDRVEGRGREKAGKGLALPGGRNVGSGYGWYRQAGTISENFWRQMRFMTWRPSTL